MIRQVDASATARKWSNVRAIIAGAVLKSATLIRLVTTTGTKTLYDGAGSSSLTLVASPASTGGGAKATTVTTLAVTVSVSGGTPPYTHDWALDLVTGAATAVALSPSSASTQFRATGVNSGGADASFIDTVTDANGITSQISVSAIFSRF